MNTDTLQYAEALSEEIISLREGLHQIPELGNKEYETSSFVASYLEKLGLEVEHFLETAVVGTLRHGEGPVIAFRADMDALPLEEKTGCPYASTHSGIMHACGHD
ncbi:MAG: amidohydrolase, partial [Spirochaetales bacterium]|nr:amidohydrolase [Candidatus Physcosoma equi]